MTPRVTAACFLVWFGRAAGNKLEVDAAAAVSTPKASTSIVITAEETSRYGRGALIYDRVVLLNQGQFLQRRVDLV